MPAKQKLSFVTRVRGELHRMHPTERRLADFVLNFPGELASYTATELARLANVSNATVSRFVQKLGYASYEEARRHVRAERHTGAALYLSGSSSKISESVLHDHVEQGKANLEKTFLGISLTEIDEVAKTMLAARRVWVIGFRTSQSFATYLQWQSLQVIENITTLPAAGQTLGENIASMTDRDCVVLFGLRRGHTRLEQILYQTIASGAAVLYITDAGVERMQGPKWHFQCQTQAPGSLFNHVSVLALCHLIATRVIELAGPAGRKRLAAIELAHDSLDEL
ncbi:MAG: MurR/RpiR family transcriptional regulator [Hyphomicrobiales bacterium]|nr:MAG: MurR/RpiR family transcriptional regulator [Hyphomicrobiales bacterium]